MEFIRFAGTINTHEEKKVAKATVNVILENCTGTFYITDIMFQEGKWLTGYVVNNLELLQKKRVDGEITPVRFFNGIVRSGVTAVITNDGEVSAGLNYHIIPKDTMAAGDMSVAHNYGSHKLTLQSGFLEDDVVTLYGQCAGLYTYETVMGNDVTLPGVYAEFIDLN